MIACNRAGDVDKFLYKNYGVGNSCFYAMVELHYEHYWILIQQDFIHTQQATLKRYS